ncbi:hypothetical protein L211DRAFT_871945 [Terfezia boudieri ATCC MYA-4762]|uniref:Uncharacterized protein n=1 Tax=Terfezia boudieri ATCC MYA-4762 TaxID=1051890 RepID=A0A3N4LBE4_9PEZI|nr:hypothetical protein L211DRAFT_871945 [Terfezia boudieri ATCC MYA-4762]
MPPRRAKPADKGKGKALSDSDPDSDPVITSYDIHLTTALAPYLHLFQYPVRSSNLPYSRLTSTCPASARIKPNAGAIELDVPINTMRNYDQEKGRQWGDALRKARLARDARISGISSSTTGAGKRRRTAADPNDSDPEDDMVYASFAEAKSAGRVLTTQTLSAHLHPQSTNYMVGVFRHKQLHLTPIHSTLQLRPQFTHIDTTISLEKDMQRALRIDPSGAPPPQARALQATVKQVGEEGAGVGGDALRALRREEGEEWVEMRWVDQDEEAAWEVFEGMFLPGGGGREEKKVDVEGGKVKETADVEGDVQMVDLEKKGDEAGEKSTLNLTTPRLKATITGAEYLRLLAAPRVDKD